VRTGHERRAKRRAPVMRDVGRHCGLAFNAGLIRRSSPLLPYLDTFERNSTRTLLVLMEGVVLLATVKLAWVLGKDLLTPPLFLPELHELLESFGQFLLVLIGIELLHMMKIYIVQRVIHLEATLIVALIAMARKIVVLEPKELPEGAL
jgi:uncharacterized membrane protein (DUF373 family)